MKTLKSLLYVFLAAFLFVGCNDDENFNPGAVSYTHLTLPTNSRV